MKKIFLTGANGFFGTRFIKFYENKYEILGVDKNNLDITNSSKLEETIIKFEPDYVIHCAAIADTNFCNKFPDIAYEVNVKAAIDVARISKKINAKMIFLSTEQVFNGNKESGPYNENMTPIPNTKYGENKLEAENSIKKIIDELWIIRFTWLFGLPEKDCTLANNILWDTIVSLIRNDEITASKFEFRGMTYVWEVINQFDKIFEIPFGTYHFGCENESSRNEVVKYILNTLSLDSSRVEDDNKFSQEFPRDIRLNTSKIRSLGFDFTETKTAIYNSLKSFGIVK